MSVITSAISRKNGITFYSEHYELQMNEKPDGNAEYLFRKFSKTSVRLSKCNVFLLRGIVDFFRVDTPVLAWVLSSIIYAFNLFTKRAGLISSMLDTIASVLLFALVVVLIGAILKMYGSPKKAFMYHGAEHKVIKALKKCEELTVYNVRRQSCYSSECGSILIVFFILVVILFSIFVPHWIFFFPICYAIAYEMFIVKDGENKPILKYAYYIGKFCQEKFVTKEPDDEIISNAITAVNKLIELEKNYK